MYQTSVFTGDVFTVAEELTEFLRANGHPGAYALAICGNPSSDGQLESYKDILRKYQAKLCQVIYRPPIHFLINGEPTSIIIVGELLNIQFSGISHDNSITVFVDKKISAYDFTE